MCNDDCMWQSFGGSSSHRFDWRSNWIINLPLTCCFVPVLCFSITLCYRPATGAFTLPAPCLRPPSGSVHEFVAARPSQHHTLRLRSRLTAPPPANQAASVTGQIPAPHLSLAASYIAASGHSACLKHRFEACERDVLGM